MNEKCPLCEHATAYHYDGRCHVLIDTKNGIFCPCRQDEESREPVAVLGERGMTKIREKIIKSLALELVYYFNCSKMLTPRRQAKYIAKQIYYKHVERATLFNMTEFLKAVPEKDHE